MKPLALLFLATVAATAQMSAPILGYVPEGSRIRVMHGIPAAGTVGDYLDVGRNLGQIAISPKQDYILATDAVTGEVLLIVPAHAPVPLAGASANPVIVLSPSGSTAALWFNEQLRAQVVTGLPTAPVIREMATPDATWLAVSDTGEIAADSSPVAFLHNSSMTVHPSLDGVAIVDIGVTNDNRAVVAADVNGALHTLDLNGNEISTVDCECSIQSLSAIGRSLFRISLWGRVKIFDASTSRIYDVPRALKSLETINGLSGVRTAKPRVLLPLSTVTIGGLPASTGPAQQPAMTISLASPYTMDVAGTATLTFKSSVGGDDQTVQFGTSGRTVSFTIAAGTTAASFSGKSSVPVLTGTVAGTITVTLAITAQGQDITPTPAPSTSTSVTANVPFVQLVQLQQASGGFNVLVSGFSTTRDMVSGNFHFAPSSNATLAATDVPVQLGAAFTTWYSNSASNATGSQFLLTVPFTTQNGPPVDIIAVTVTLTNSKGTSTAVVNQ